MIQMPEEVIEHFRSVFRILKPCVWILNFADGSSASSLEHENILKISPERRKEIRAFRLQLDENTYTISRKIPRKSEEPKIIKGFFYHIKEGYAPFMGKSQVYGFQIPFAAERIGFCYSRNGDSMCIHVSHLSFIKEVYKRLKFLEERYSSAEVYQINLEEFLKQPITYKPNVNGYKENLIEKRVAIDRFGALEDLEVSDLPPRIMENTKEVAIHPKFTTSL